MAISSAASELYGVVKCACEALGVRTLCINIGWSLDIRFEIDVMVLNGILDRQGISKVRHIDVNCLWLQEQTAKKLVSLVKIAGEVNTADLMAKHLGNAVMLKHLQNLHLMHKTDRWEADNNIIRTCTRDSLCRTIAKYRPGPARTGSSSAASKLPKRWLEKCGTG